MQDSWKQLNLGMFAVKKYIFQFETRNKMLALEYELPGSGVGEVFGPWLGVCALLRRRKIALRDLESRG